MPRVATSGSFKKGEAKGRPKGVPNKLTEQMRTVKEYVLATFEELQKDPKQDLKAFAAKYPRDFYQIAAKLIPTEVKADVSIQEIVWNETKTYESNKETE